MSTPRVGGSTLLLAQAGKAFVRLHPLISRLERAVRGGLSQKALSLACDPHPTEGETRGRA
jgi:hypothetical protein